jgi:predicted amidophosphoribosyltransferase
VTRAARGIIPPRVTQAIANRSGLFCPDCGYDLQAIESERCPECGLIIDRTALGQSVIPWLHRSSIGRFRAFWRTVNMATFRPRQLAQELVQPARFRDAVLFRRLVVLDALIPLGLIFTGGYLALLNESGGGVWSPM